MAQQRPGFDLSKLSTTSKILLGGGVAYIVVSFLPYWQRVCVPLVGCASANGWQGVGLIAGLLGIAIAVMELLVAGNVEVNVGTAAQRYQIEALMTFGVLVFTVLRILIDNDFLSWAAWVGLILSGVLAYGGYLRWQEARVVAPPSPGAPA